ncbi:ABC transporter ATP-binding protein [Actinotignum sp. GS-2025a]|uniref:ABC transporter ATP-binding protein n=1 Tax=Actinotignum sp. GS-2025a TaxID=3427274 RepID=UPI003F474C3D
MNSIEINGLVKNYPGFTLGPLDLRVPQGAIVGFVGENGAGKSTTLRLILGLAHPDAGTIHLLGQPADTCHPEARERVGVVFDDISLPANFTVKNTCEFGKRLYKNWNSQTFAGYQQRFGLASGKRVDQLSRGMRMKLGLAMALSHAADLLIFDEATSGLDPVIRDEVLDIMLEFIEDPSHSILFSSHIVSDIEKAADYVAFIRNGKLKFVEQKDKLLDSWRLTSLTSEQANQLDPAHVLGRRRHDFGQEVIVRTEAVPAGAPAARPTIEDIMVYTIKGEDQ